MFRINNGKELRAKRKSPSSAESFTPLRATGRALNSYGQSFQVWLCGGIMPASLIESRAFLTPLAWNHTLEATNTPSALTDAATGSPAFLWLAVALLAFIALHGHGWEVQLDRGPLLAVIGVLHC